MTRKRCARANCAKPPSPPSNRYCAEHRIEHGRDLLAQLDGVQGRLSRGAQAKTTPSDPLPPEIQAALEDMADMLNGVGRHADHKREQVGRCAYCSCGLRAQGRLRHGA